MKVTLIGGSGFVGTNICQHLADRQIPFEIVDIRESQRFPEKCKIADIRDLDALRGAITGDVILHLAAVHRDDVRDKSEYYRTNVDGTANIAQVCQEKGIKKIVFTSTVAVYGFAEPGTDETGEINPFNAYGDSKFKGEEKLRSWQVDAGNSLVIVRPTVTGRSSRISQTSMRGLCIRRAPSHSLARWQSNAEEDHHEMCEIRPCGRESEGRAQRVYQRPRCSVDVGAGDPRYFASVRYWRQ